MLTTVVLSLLLATEGSDAGKAETSEAAKVSEAPSEVLRNIAKVETGGEKDPFIRIREKNAPKEGSSAYGPLQVTKTLADDYIDRKADLFTPEEMSYLKRFSEQGTKFLKHGRNKGKEGYDANYDYGAKGDLDSPADREMYWQVFGKVVEDRLGTYPTDEEIARLWHGGSDEGKISNYVRKLNAAK